MRLYRHDELVEAMARAIHEQHDVGPWDKSPAWQKIWRADATAALDALLEAVVRLGVGREAGATYAHPDRGLTWVAAEHWVGRLGNIDQFLVLILRMEASDDK
jgi:hypothetical protein